METSKGHWMKEGKKNKGIEGGEGLKGEIFYVNILKWDVSCFCA